MSVPRKYRAIGDFHEYYSGTRTAPCLTIFIGGNHEASNHLWELYYGGWVAPRIYYLGAANVVRFGPLRIAGLSGIWKGYDYNKSHYERLPYDKDDLKSVYHVRELDVRKLLQIRTPVDLGLSHDWPRGIEWMGNWKALFKQKEHFEPDARDGTLGSAAARYVMDRLRPRHWFSAHLHCKFTARVAHAVHTSEDQGKEVTPLHHPSTSHNQASVRNADEIDVDLEDENDSSNAVAPSTSMQNEDEIVIDVDDENSNEISSPKPSNSSILHNESESFQTQIVPDDVRAKLPASFAATANQNLTTISQPPAITNTETRFLALDKCLPKRKFLEIIEMDISEFNSNSSPNPPFQFSFDKEWLAITRVFATDLHLGNVASRVPPNQGEATYLPHILAEEKWVEDNIEKKGLMLIPDNFETTAPVYDPAIGIYTDEQPPEYTNPQTAAFCRLLGIENRFHASEEERRERRMDFEAGKAVDRTNEGANIRNRGRGLYRNRGRGRGGDRRRGASVNSHR